MKNNNQYFKLFASCVVVNGHSNAAIYDLGRNIVYSISLSFSKFLETYNENKICEVYLNYDKTKWGLIDKYFNFLTTNDLIFVTELNSSFENLKAIDFSYEYPFKLSGLIVSFESTENWLKLAGKVLFHIREINCKNIQLRFSKFFGYNDIIEVLTFFKNSNFLSNLSIIINVSVSSEIFNKKNTLKIQILNSIIFYGGDVIINEKQKKMFDNIEVVIYRGSDFPRFNNLNDLRFLNFNPNIISFSEAKNHNIYHNRKAYISGNGNIYQSPFNFTLFGNIFNDSLKKIISIDSFKEFWDITKDKIEVCKDCEFRYVCNDGRVPLKKSKTDIYYFTDKCNYNPYQMH